MSQPAHSISFARCPLFHGMSPGEREEIVALLEPQSFRPEETILSEGPTLQCLWILTHGTVRVVKTLANGHVQELTRLEPFNVFGEMSFFAPAPHSASVQAVSEVEVSRLSREKYDMLLRVGSLAAYAAAKAIAALLFNTEPADPLIFAAMIGLLTAVALLAGHLPARRASRIDPMLTLRGA